MKMKICVSDHVYIGKTKAVPELENGLVVGIYDEMLEEDNPDAWELQYEQDEYNFNSFRQLRSVILSEHEEVTIIADGKHFSCIGYNAPDELFNETEERLRYMIENRSVSRKEFQTELKRLFGEVA